MRTFLLALILTGFINATTFCPVAAQPVPGCEWYPSSDCPATPRGYSSYPCRLGQIKADQNTGLYHSHGQTYYNVTGYEINADTWCFDMESQAYSAGFRRAPY